MTGSRRAVAVACVVCLLAGGRPSWPETVAATQDVDSEASETSPAKLDPAAWGSDHVGKPVPEYLTGDECLFCHRNDVGPAWGSNPHARIIRLAGPDSSALAALLKSPALRTVAEETGLVLLGSRRSVRFLRPNGYGRLSLLAEKWVPAKDNGKKIDGTEPHGKLTPADRPHWQENTFAKSCAGCHTTGVDAEQRFSEASLDCYVCHGDGKLDHSKDTTRIFLAKKRADPARVVVSICAQCHVRTGKSRSTGLPYPNNFVPGDNLWRDFAADFSDRAMKALSPSDRHILANVRDVVLDGKERITCLTCHDVHKGSSRKHKRFRRREICWHCHDRENIEKVFHPLDAHNSTCGY